MTAISSDVAVIGGGIVGLAAVATARRRWPDAEVVQLDASSTHQGRSTYVTAANGTGPLAELLRRSDVRSAELDECIVALHPVPLPPGLHAVSLSPSELAATAPALRSTSGGSRRGVVVIDAATLDHALRASSEHVRVAATVRGISFRCARAEIDTDGPHVSARRVINVAGHDVLRLCAGGPDVAARSQRETIVEYRSLGPLSLDSENVPDPVVRIVFGDGRRVGELTVVQRPDGYLSIRSSSRTLGESGRDRYRRSPEWAIVRGLLPSLPWGDLREASSSQRSLPADLDPRDAVVAAGPVAHVLHIGRLDAGHRDPAAAVRAAEAAVALLTD